MDSLDLQVLRQARDWKRDGHDVWLVTVIETWGSAPRPPGALLAMRGDGLVVGSVSGGCVEDDLIDRVRGGERVATPSLVTYGVTKEEAARFGLPCGGNLRLVQEPLTDIAWIDEVLQRTAAHQLVARRLDMKTGRVSHRVRVARRGLRVRRQDPARAVRPTLADVDHRRRPALARAGANGAGAGLRGHLLRSARGIPPDVGHRRHDVQQDDARRPGDRTAARPAQRRDRGDTRSQARRHGLARSLEVAGVLRRRARLAGQHRQTPRALGACSI